MGTTSLEEFLHAFIFSSLRSRGDNSFFVLHELQFSGGGLLVVHVNFTAGLGLDVFIKGVIFRLVIYSNLVLEQFLFGFAVIHGVT